MRSARRGRWIHRLFEIGIVMKGIDGVLEIAGGILLFLVSADRIGAWARILTRAELKEDPDDLVANYILHSSSHLSASAQTFGAVYLLVHGVIKVALVAALFLGLRRAYPTAIAAFGFFLVYQAYHFAQSRSPELLVLSAIDVFVIVLTWLEYARLRDAGAFSGP